MMHGQCTMGLALAAALVAAPLAAQDTTGARTRGDTARMDTTRIDTTGTVGTPDTVSTTPRMYPTRLDTSGVETGAVDTAVADTTMSDTTLGDTTAGDTMEDTAELDTTMADTARVETAPDDTTTVEAATGYETGVVRPGQTSDTAAARTGVRPTAGIVFIDREGQQLGTGQVVQTDRGVLITADLSGLPAGEHAFHVHETGRCDAPSFESAGDHYAPNQRQHGFLVNGGPHAGDMPNRRVGQDGSLDIEEHNAFVTLSGREAPLLDQDGSALIIHAKADDYRSQPSGEAGDRIACAIVQRTGGQPQQQ